MGWDGMGKGNGREGKRIGEKETDGRTERGIEREKNSDRD